MWRFTANTGKLEFMAWDVMRTLISIDLTVKKGNLGLPVIADIRL